MPDPQADSSLIAWVLGGMVTVVGSLAGAVAALWRQSETRNGLAIAKLETRLEVTEQGNIECQKDRARLSGVTEQLKAQVHRLEERLQLKHPQERMREERTERD